MRILLLLALLAATALGALFNLISALLGLGLVPEFAGSWIFFAVKTQIGNLLLWLAFGTAMVMALAILRDRQPRREPTAPSREGLPDDPAVIVVLTAYNDALSIGGAVEDFIRQSHVRQVIVVDNNCVDETALVAARAGATVVQETKQGYGFACMRGLREALRFEPDAVVLAEGDGTFAGRDIAKLLPYLDDADMVLGNRITPGLVDRNSQMDTFFVWGNQIGGKLIQLKFWEWRFWGRARISDLGCTMRALRPEALEAIIDDLEVGGSHFSAHMIMVALRHRLLTVEVPITFWPRVGLSKGASQGLKQGTRIGLAMLWHIVTFPSQQPGPLFRPTAESSADDDQLEERAA